MKNFIRFTKYFIAGGVAALVDIGVFLKLINLGLPYHWSGFFSFIVATAVNFFLSKRYVFHDRPGNDFQKIVGTYIASSVGLLLNQVILWISIEKFLLLPLFAKLTATGVVFFWNYYIRNYYVFKNRS